MWESYPTNEWGYIAVIDPKDLYTKKCVGSVTHDEWGIVGSGYFKDYNPDVLVESKLSITRSVYKNHDDPVPGIHTIFLQIIQ